MNIKGIIKMLEVSLKDHKKYFKITFPVKSIYFLVDHSSLTLNAINATSMDIYLTIVGARWNHP